MTNFEKGKLILRWPCVRSVSVDTNCSLYDPIMICEGTVIILGLLPLASNYYFSKKVPKHHAMEVCRRCERKFCSSESQRETYYDLVSNSDRFYN